LSKQPAGGEPLSVAREEARAMKAEAEQKRLAKLGPDAAKLDPHTRLNLDKRSARKLNRKHFMAAIANIRSRLESGVKLFKPRSSGTGSGVSVFMRKRPLFVYEQQRGEFDVVTASARSEVLIHNCQMHPDMKRMKITSVRYPCDRTFDTTATNEEVYDSAVSPLVLAVSQKGLVASIFMYGQTGSGKTYTMGSIIEKAVRHVYALGTKQSGGKYEVTLTFYELAGKKCVDLLGQKEVLLRENKSGGVTAVGADQRVEAEPKELLKAIHLGYDRRKTDATDVNNTSSRSHAICQLSLPNGGVLTLVDCAGSERKQDSMHHDAKRQKETAEINSSLHALKECIRCIVLKKLALKRAGGNVDAAKHVHIPFRGSNLTKILRRSFVDEDALVAVIVTLSPSTTDTEHSVGTLRTACMLGGREGEVQERTEEVDLSLPEEEILVPPTKFSASEVQKWLATAEKGKFSSFLIDNPWVAGMDGKQLCRLTEQKLTILCNDSSSGRDLFRALRKAIQMAADGRKKRLVENKMVARNEKYGGF
jgi:kinesin family protein 2/24